MREVLEEYPTKAYLREVLQDYPTKADMQEILDVRFAAVDRRFESLEETQREFREDLRMMTRQVILQTRINLIAAFGSIAAAAAIATAIAA